MVRLWFATERPPALMPVIALIPFEIPFFMFILLLAWFVLGPGGLSAFQGQDARAPYTIRRFRRIASVLP